MLLSKTRRKFTFLFATLMIWALISFNVITYFFLSSIIYNETEKEIQIMADHESEKHKIDLMRNSEAEKNGVSSLDQCSKPNEHDLNISKKNGDVQKDREKNRTVLRPFYFLVNQRGEFIRGEMPRKVNLDTDLPKLKDWIPKPGEVRYLALENTNGRTVNVMFAGRPIYDEGKYLGTIYIGAEITQQMEVLRKLIVIMTFLSVIFLLLFGFLGYILSGMVMKPIVRVFNNQKQFVADASHELRTPISVLHAALELLELEEQERMQPFSKQVLQDLKDEVMRMSALISHMLTLARGDSSEYELQLNSFSMNEELEKLYRKVLPLTETKNQHLLLHIDPGLNVRADRERILQLLMILIDNAMQYTPDYGTIQITAEAKNGLLVLTVSDTGIGIAKHKQQEIFERFYRDDVSRSRTSGNLGLGLSIAKWIAEIHGGTIRVQSELGMGSVFIVTLPVLR